MEYNIKKSTPGTLRSIWDNTFYNDPPALSWTYKLNFDEFVNFTINDIDNKPLLLISENDMKTLNNAAVSINIGERKINNTDIYYGGLAFKVLTRVENNGTFSVKFNENHNLKVTSILEKIYSLYGVNKFYFKNNSSNIIPYASNMTYDNNILINSNTKHNIISVKIFNHKCLNDNQEEENYKQYKFFNCKLLGIENIDYDYESKDSITRNATFSYDWLEFNEIYENNEATL